MKTAVVGSRKLNVDCMYIYIPSATTEIVSGGAKGVDAVAREYAREKNYKYSEFLPNYEKYGKAAPLKRNDEIIDYADLVVAIWDGKSKGTKYVIDKCKKIGKSLLVFGVYIDKETNLTEIKSWDYYNLTALGNETLKDIIMAELDGETDIDIDRQLINACAEAIAENKYVPLRELIFKELKKALREKHDRELKLITELINS